MTTHKERNAQTEAAIVAALVTVGHNKPLNQITITDIIKNAGISRGTFYLHYLDKEDLLEELKSHFMVKFRQIIGREMINTMDEQALAAGEPYPILIDVLSLFSSSKPLMALLLGPNGDASFYGTIVNELQAAIVRELRTIKGNANFISEIPRTYAINLVTNTIVSTIMVWLSGNDNLTSSEVAHIIMRELYLSPYQMLGISR
ncbi:TetR/AcrR family transcriptional regulator [Lacticaseibacillus zhaodongensis]|uniref:TetR/AcrR family transcriptional regulator n=1 Tax=Lacticaseibacillus zhaodongensis TaxID=2668065 RepID=UPI0012D2D181|nr:TetR/AcrR family transcriptional regulator [Lacticaseibacillus zhaodongensis]